MDRSEKSPSIPLFQRGKIQAPRAKRVYRHSRTRESSGGWGWIPAFAGMTEANHPTARVCGFVGIGRARSASGVRADMGRLQ